MSICGSIVVCFFGYFINKLMRNYMHNIWWHPK